MRLLFGATLFLAVTCMNWTTALSQDFFEERVFSPRAGEQLKYRLMLPKDYSPTGTEEYPLVLFLHGAGERGDDNLKQLVHGMKDFSKEENRQKYPCFVIAPQCPEGKRWVEVDWTLDAHTQPAESTPLALTRELIELLRNRLKVDSKRIYVTGLSMGGFGTWDLVTRTPDLFAAAAPICGGADEALAGRVTKLPIWAFHGDKDSVVKVERSRRMIDAIQKAGGMPKYTEYPEVNHDSWTRTYADPKFMEWLFAQKRP